MTGLLVIMFVPVFSSYTAPDQKKIEAIEKNKDAQYKSADSLIATTLAAGSDTSFAKSFLKDKAQTVIVAQLDSLGKSSAAASNVKAVSDINASIINENKEIGTLKQPLEQKRMYWLLGALAVIIVSLVIANLSAQKNQNGWGAMKYPQLVLGMLALFFYVGVEVAVGSNLTELLKHQRFCIKPWHFLFRSYQVRSHVLGKPYDRKMGRRRFRIQFIKSKKNPSSICCSFHSICYYHWCEHCFRL
jgi:FHS family L-fucose permease-like MFS transporter